MGVGKTTSLRRTNNNFWNCVLVAAMLVAISRAFAPPASLRRHMRRTTASVRIRSVWKNEQENHPGLGSSSSLTSNDADDDAMMDDILEDVDQLLLVKDAKELINDSSTDHNNNCRRIPSWRMIQWDNGTSSLRSNATALPYTSSPVEQKVIQGRTVHIKRDDLLRLHGSQISGNKARKMLAMNEIPIADFPKTVVSYGGPQSNSMLALAAIVNYKNRELYSFSKNNKKEQDIDEDNSNTKEFEMIRFLYYTKKLPRFLRNQPSGNLFRAQSLGMELVELSHDEYSNMFGSDWGVSSTPPVGLEPPEEESLWVPQGGAFGMAQRGTRVLAEEILSYWHQEGDFRDRPLSVCLPGGTCSTACLLHHQMQRLMMERPEYSGMDVEVVVVPCVGDDAYARRQMMALSSSIGEDPNNIPAILLPSPDEAHKNSSKHTRYFNFGAPDKGILDTYQHMKEEYGLVLDLIYGAPAWAVMLRHWHTSVSLDTFFDPNNPVSTNRELMYVHSGGLEGINSQLMRYQYKGLLSIRDVQLPGRRDKSKRKEQR